MRVKRIIIGLSMILRMLLRRRIILLALAVIPVVFLSAVHLTTSDNVVPFRLASIDESTVIEASQKGISLIFFAVTSTGFLVSFLALNLIQIDSAVNRRLVICGYHPIELLISKLCTLLLMIWTMAIYLGLLTNTFFPVKHLLMFIYGLTLIGFVYGCYGLAVGSLIKGELEGVFLVVLLANIDVGWLQNPTFYAEAQNKAIIQYLPGYFPSQSAIIAGLTDYSAINARLYSILIGSGFLLLSMLIFYNKMRMKK